MQNRDGQGMLTALCLKCASHNMSASSDGGLGSNQTVNVNSNGKPPVIEMTYKIENAVSQNSQPPRPSVSNTYSVDTFARAVSLRMQLTRTDLYSSSTTHRTKVLRAFADYLMCCSFLFFTVFNFIG